MAAVPTSPYLGVHWSTRARKWVAQYRVDGRSRYIGSYANEQDAAEAVDEFRERLERARERREREARRPLKGTWESRVVESLRESKRSGLSFEEGWTLALRLNPPRGRDVSHGGTLFDADAPSNETLIAAFKRFTDDAWHGRRPKLAGFSLELLRGSDGSRPARRGRLHRAA